MENKSSRRRKIEEDKIESDDENYVPYVSVKQRKQQKLMKLGRIGQLKDAGVYGTAKSSSENEKDEGEDEDIQSWGRKFNISLLDQHTELKKLAEGKYSFFFYYR